VIARRLEGSRLGAYQTNPRYSLQRFIRRQNVAAGGSRELPSVMDLRLALRSVYVRPKSCGALGRSREPPAAARFGGIRDGTNLRGRRNTCQSGTPPGVRRSHVVTPNGFFEDEDDYKNRKGEQMLAFLTKGCLAAEGSGGWRTVFL